VRSSRPFLFVSFLLVVAPAAQVVVPPAPIDSPNILLLVTDDVGVANIGAYRLSATAPPTPNLDALAGRGVLFRRAYANPLCSPTRACIQTGRYSFRTGVGTAITPNNPASPPLPLAEHTLPEILDAARAGYAHACIGKWHLGSEASVGGMSAPNRAGYGHFAGHLLAAVQNYYAWPRVVDGVSAQSTTYATTQNVDDALSWIRTARSPWICMVNFNASHSPFHTPPAHLHTYNLAGLNPNVTPLPFYKAAIQAMDREIGRLLAGLGNALASTDVFFLGDNGTPVQVVEPPYVAGKVKGTTFEGGIHVPLIVAGPSVYRGGRESTALVSAVDLFATFAEICGVQPARVVPPGTRLDGISFLSQLRQPGKASARTLVFSEVFAGTNPNIAGSSSLRNAI
jgi:arylsulfatase A-like enzyme